MKKLGRSKKLRLLGGLLVGAATAGVAAGIVMQKLLKQEFVEQHPRSPQESDQEVEEAEDPEGVTTFKTRHMELSGVTHEGKRRSNNQDSFRLSNRELAGEKHALAIVCDGMGGHAGGEVASQIAADLIQTVVSKQKSPESEGIYQAIKEAIERADAAIEQRASKENDLLGMGTTAVVAVVNRDNYVHCYLGDSRLYHYRNGEFIYQTKDHSVVRFLVEEGIIGPEEAKDHPYRSQLTSSLGGGPNANRLTIEPKWDDEKIPYREWQSGDWLVLCSDGLNSELEDEEIAAVLAEAEDTRSAALELRDRVLKTLARDNVTVIVAHKL